MGRTWAACLYRIRIVLIILAGVLLFCELMPLIHPGYTWILDNGVSGQ